MSAENPKPIRAPQKVFDIKPGHTAPGSSSKPIIITNRPVLKDPMVVDEPKKAEPSKATDPKQNPSVTKIKIGPLNEELKASLKTLTGEKASEPHAETDTEEPKPPEPTEEIKKEAPKPEPKSEPEARPGKEEPTPPTEPVKHEAPAEPETDKDNDVDADELGNKAKISEADKRKAEEAAAQKEAVHQAELQKIVVSKEYFLPINAVEKRRTKRFSILGIILILLLAVAWADLSLDAGIISIHGIKPLTHFFSK